MNIIGRRAAREGDGSSSMRRNAPGSLKRRIVYIPPMSDHAHALAAAFERCGIESEVLPESDGASAELGMKYVSGKECYPCALTTGDMLKKALSRDFDASRSAFFMPSGSGPCRFGQYNVFHRMVLDDLGMTEVPIFAPNQDTGLFDSLEQVGSRFVLTAWRGIVSVDLLTKCLHETRPYEIHKGSADAAYQHHLGRLVKSLRGTNGSLKQALEAIRRDFDAVPKTEGRKPRIGIIGEIYVRSNKYSNGELVRSIESLGGEAALATFGEWIWYLNAMSIRRDFTRRKLRAAAHNAITAGFMLLVEKMCSLRFRKSLKSLPETSTAEILKLAAPYLPDSFEGEAVLSVGKSIALAQQGASGIINVMPFGCMPGTIVTALMKAVTRDLDVPVINIAYDGTETSTNDIQLEAFMDQAGARAERFAA